MPQPSSLCFRRGAKEDCCRLAAGLSVLEGGDILIAPLSVPTDGGSAAGGFAAFASCGFVH